MLSGYEEIVRYLESLQMMPKTMPGLEKIKQALTKTAWFGSLDPGKIVVVAGTNGKGTTCAALESLLLAAGQSVGFYSSPHLVSTTERMRRNGRNIEEAEFVRVFRECAGLIEEFKLSHFEALTLMAGQFFFGRKQPDYTLFEVGLGGTFDATNAFPHKYSIIAKLGMDHTNILGTSIEEVARNKFGIIGRKNIVVHHELPPEIAGLKAWVQKTTNSNWIEADKFELVCDRSGVIPLYRIRADGSEFAINIPGERGAENIMTALTAFRVMGFDTEPYLGALNKIQWSGRMQRINWPLLKCPLFLSGDHNPQGVESLIRILRDFTWRKIHIIAGIGSDKDCGPMLQRLTGLSEAELYLTETPFKGLTLDQYPSEYLQKAKHCDRDVKALLSNVAAEAASDDLAVVTGSLYLVGEVLKAIQE